MARSPPTKRIKLELSPIIALDDPHPPESEKHEEEEEADEERCSICLQAYEDRTMIPTCSHEFCFECLSCGRVSASACLDDAPMTDIRFYGIPIP